MPKIRLWINKNYAKHLQIKGRDFAALCRLKYIYYVIIRKGLILVTMNYMTQSYFSTYKKTAYPNYQKHNTVSHLLKKTLQKQGQ